MIRVLRSDGLRAHPALARTMFTDRAAQFSARLGWDVTLNSDGEERDQYDALDPTYVIWDDAGRHGGSLRFLPTRGRTMLEEHFSDLTQGVAIRSPYIWECTRFCLAANASRGVAAALMLAGLEVGLRVGLNHAAGVFDAPMIRVYRKQGWAPALLGTRGKGRGAISAGLWVFDASYRTGLMDKAGVSRRDLETWFGEAESRAA